ncbi:hypothetical protein D3C86_1969100 [compost metagenome]
MRDIALAAVAFKQQMLRARRVEAFRQKRACAFDGAFAVNPHRPGKLFRGEKITQTREAARVRKIVCRAGYDANICVAHKGVLFAKR